MKKLYFYIFSFLLPMILNASGDKFHMNPNHKKSLEKALEAKVNFEQVYLARKHLQKEMVSMRGALYPVSEAGLDVLSEIVASSEAIDAIRVPFYELRKQFLEIRKMENTLDHIVCDQHNFLKREIKFTELERYFKFFKSKMLQNFADPIKGHLFSQGASILTYVMHGKLEDIQKLNINLKTTLDKMLLDELNLKKYERIRTINGYLTILDTVNKPWFVVRIKELKNELTNLENDLIKNFKITYELDHGKKEVSSYFIYWYFRQQRLMHQGFAFNAKLALAEKIVPKAPVLGYLIKGLSLPESIFDSVTQAVITIISRDTFNEEKSVEASKKAYESVSIKLNSTFALSLPDFSDDSLVIDSNIGEKVFISKDELHGLLSVVSEKNYQLTHAPGGFLDKIKGLRTGSIPTTHAMYNFGGWKINLETDFYARIYSGYESADWWGSEHADTYDAMAKGLQTKDLSFKVRMFLNDRLDPASCSENDADNARFIVAKFVSESVRRKSIWTINMMLMDLLEDKRISWDSFIYLHPMKGGSFANKIIDGKTKKDSEIRIDELKIMLLWLQTYWPLADGIYPGTNCVSVAGSEAVAACGGAGSSSAVVVAPSSEGYTAMKTHYLEMITKLLIYRSQSTKLWENRFIPDEYNFSFSSNRNLYYKKFTEAEYLTKIVENILEIEI